MDAMKRRWEFLMSGPFSQGSLNCTHGPEGSQFDFVNIWIPSDPKEMLFARIFGSAALDHSP
jgi:hypothetical protein